jgi:microcystin-dependent protein
MKKFILSLSVLLLSFNLSFAADDIKLLKDLSISTGKKITLGTIQWNSGDSIDGTKVANADLGDIGVSSGVWSVENDSHTHGSGTITEADPLSATKALNNLASVAINTSLISDTANTDDLGTEAIFWRKLYLGSSISFEGATDDAYQTTLIAVDPTVADKTINIPNANGTMAVSATTPITLSALGDIGHSAANGYVHTPANGASTQLLQYSSAGTSKWITVSGDASIADGGVVTVPAKSPTGSIVMWTTTTAPTGWLLCDGSAVSRTTYATLFAVIGTTFGVGDNSTTFNVPNLKSRFPVGYNSADTDFDAIGETGGAKTHVNAQAQHTHGFTSTATTFTLAAGTQVGTYTPAYSATTTSKSVTGTTNNSAAVNTGAADHKPPYITLNFIIKY